MDMENNEFSAFPVKQDQLVSWPRVAAVSMMISFSLPVFITGLEVSNGLSVNGTIAAFIIGTIIVTLFGSIMGVIGAQTRANSYMLVRIAFGDKGAGLVNIAFALSLIGWFGVNIDLFSDAVNRLLIDLFNINIPVWIIEVSAGLCMIITTIFGFSAINILASLMAPILAIVTYLLMSATFKNNSLSTLLATESKATMSVGDGVSAITGAIIIGAIILPDITRFVKHWSGAVYTVVCSYGIVEMIVMIAAALAGISTGLTEILDVMLALGLGLSAFGIVIAGSWVLNSLNLYSAVLSIGATFPKLNSKAVTIVIGIAGVGAAFLNILDIFITFLSVLAVIFVPVVGIIVMDYWIIRPEAYVIEGEMENGPAISVKAFAGWAVGAVYAAFGTFADMPSLSNIIVIDSIIISAIIYVAISYSGRKQATKNQGK